MSRSDKSLFNKINTNTKPSFVERYNRKIDPLFSNFAGSWTAQYSLDNYGISNNFLAQPAARQKLQSHLGLPGFPEIRFRPYDFNTSRDKRQPSLLGHPISFEFVGPTLKSSFNNVQWLVTDNTNTPDGDVLTLDSITCYSTSASIEAATITTIEDLFGITEIPEEGLYLFVSMTGSKVFLDSPIQSSVGDGFIGVDLDPRNALEPLTQTSKFEIFRVVSVGLDSLTLASNKRLSDFFDISATNPVIRSICLIKPALTRLLPLPGTDGKVYAFMPPERSLTQDHLHPYSTWTSGGFTAWDNFDTAFTGNDLDYRDIQRIPIPAPVKRGKGSLTGSDTPSYVFTYVNRLCVNVPDDMFSLGDRGRLLHIYNIDVREDTGLYHPDDTGSLIKDPGLDPLLGWFEIIDYNAGSLGDPDTINLKRVTTQNPYDGVMMETLGDMFVVRNPINSYYQIQFDFTVHNKVSDFYKLPIYDGDLTYNYTFSPKDLEETRLPKLIDPSQSRVNLQSFEDGLPYRNYVDKSIFDTSASVYGYSDPGSLLDLGFRVVLYPPKYNGSELVPDYDRPLFSHYLTLDPDVEGEQYYEIDYDAGLLYLSHAINVKEGCDIYTDQEELSLASNNIMGGVPLFAACVAYSRDNNEKGISILGSNAYVSGTSSDYTSGFGSRLVVPLENQTFNDPIYPDLAPLILKGSYGPADIPSTGFIELVEGYYATNIVTQPIPFDPNLYPLNVYYYSRVGFSGPTTLYVSGGYDGGSFSISDEYPYSVVFRRDLFLPTESNGSIGTGLQNDVFYGSEQRTDTFKFKNAVLTPDKDGSMIIDINHPGEVEITVGPDSIFSLARKEMQSQAHFTTLEDAFAHIADLETKFPTLTFKIRVIGSTFETGTLTVPVNGLILEGDSGWAAVSQSNIQWSFDGPLMDLDGRDNVQIRNLNFKWVDDASAIDTTPERFVLTTSSSAQNLLMENCFLFGNEKAHGFLHIPSGESLKDSIFRNCQIRRVSDYPFYILGTFENCLIDSCYIDQNGAVGQVVGNTTAFYLDGFGIKNLTVSNCYINGFDYNISSNGSLGLRLVNNVLEGSAFSAIELINQNDYGASFPESYATIVKDNKIVSCYTTSDTSKQAIYLTGGNDIHILNNWISIDDGGVISGIYGVRIVDGSNHIVSHNVCYNNSIFCNSYNCLIESNGIYHGDLYVSQTQNIIRNNFIGLPNGLVGLGLSPGGIFIANTGGEDHVIEGNFIQTGTISVPTGHSIACLRNSVKISNNTCLSSIYVDNDGCMVQNNKCSGLSITSNADSTLVSGNYIGSAVTIAGQGCLFQGNYVDSTVDATGTNTSFSGNIVTGVVTVTTDNFLAVGNVFSSGVSSGGIDPDSNPYSSLLVANNLGTATGLFGGAPDSLGRTHNVY